MRFAIRPFLLVMFSMPVCANAPGQKPPTSCAGRAALDSAVYDTTGITEMPAERIHESVHLIPPPVLWSKRVGDSVLVGLVVNADGRPDSGSIDILRHAQSQYGDAFDSAAVRWVRRPMFWPGCTVSNPVRVRTAVPIRFIPPG